MKKSNSETQVDQNEVELVVKKPAKKKPKPVVEEQPDPVSEEEKDNPIAEDLPVKEQDSLVDQILDCYTVSDESNQEEEKPVVDDDYDVLEDLLSDSNTTTANPVSKQHPEIPAESIPREEAVSTTQQRINIKMRKNIPLTLVDLLQPTIFEPITEEPHITDNAVITNMLESIGKGGQWRITNILNYIVPLYIE
ncbi:hypothetical protein C1646_766695 [Rhizophagus diaphanus]|nr:hypothetical protein C1646_766695 [Rhizophagus diaphanus] [Rhizophagus sp. MUCL 43196]